MRLVIYDPSGLLNMIVILKKELVVTNVQYNLWKFVIFLSKIARASFRFSLVSAVGVWIALAAISHFMIMDFPPGILQGYIELPWPIN